ncbi:MAG TPA: 2-dehydropantoate 2-reductase N-terminal domain-containing protein, partial [Blastocatellia bacterium]|nr:2-dehydropantoate 2-reductase N-terminal domain-containing protein [Blastocatellia bacterium]
MSDGKQPRYVIVGAGAVGCTVGGLLARVGSRVVCVARPALAGALRT